MIEKLCTGREMEIIIIVLLVVLLLVSIGKGTGKLLVPLCKKLLGREEVNINIAPELSGNGKREFSETGRLFDPKCCLAHKSEMDRSLRNEADIKDLWRAHTEQRRDIATKLEILDRDNQRIILALINKGFNVPGV